MCGLLAKCAALYVMIHGFRALTRHAGPQWSGLALGLPSTTAIVLLVCGWEHGSEAATAMAESSLLGLAAAVALPLVYTRAVWLGWCLPTTVLAAVAGYLGVASGLGCLPPSGLLCRLSMAAAAIAAASCFAHRLPVPVQSWRRPAPSPRHKLVVRLIIPALYVLAVALADTLAGPTWTGLMSTFPSMSLVVLAVTHLEGGPAEASRIARVLPAGNLSTLSFLAALRAGCPTLGLTGGLLAGYTGALISVLLVAAVVRRHALWHLASGPNSYARLRSSGLPTGFAAHQGSPGIRTHAHGRLARRQVGRTRLYNPQRHGFFPLVETLG
jgi:hypothetical protein